MSIARALANKPAILFADEPTGNLDGKSGREVLTLLRQVSHELGITLVLVTHDLNVAEQAERIIQLEDGHIARDTLEGGAQTRLPADIGHNGGGVASARPHDGEGPDGVVQA